MFVNFTMESFQVQPHEIKHVINDYLTSPDEGCNVGTVRLTGPERIVNVSGYYTWWLIGGWCIAAHRLYLGEWLMPLVITFLSVSALVLFIVWGVVLLFTLDGGGILVFASFLFCVMFVAIAWLFDMYRGCALVDHYNGEMELALLGEEAKANSDKITHKLIRAAVLYEKKKLSSNPRNAKRMAKQKSDNMV